MSAPPAPEDLAAVIAAARACRVCAAHLPLGPRPILRAKASARLLIVGQAPGTRVHETGIPFNDPSVTDTRNRRALGNALQQTVNDGGNEITTALQVRGG